MVLKLTTALNGPEEPAGSEPGRGKGEGSKADASSRELGSSRSARSTTRLVNQRCQGEQRKGWPKVGLHKKVASGGWRIVAFLFGLKSFKEPSCSAEVGKSDLFRVSWRYCISFLFEIIVLLGCRILPLKVYSFVRIRSDDE